MLGPVMLMGSARMRSCPLCRTQSAAADRKQIAMNGPGATHIKHGVRRDVLAVPRRFGRRLGPSFRLDAACEAASTVRRSASAIMIACTCLAHAGKTCGWGQAEDGTGHSTTSRCENIRLMFQSRISRAVGSRSAVPATHTHAGISTRAYMAEVGAGGASGTPYLLAVALEGCPCPGPRRPSSPWCTRPQPVGPSQSCRCSAPCPCARS